MGLALEPTSSTALGLLLLQLWTQRGRRAREVVALQTSSAHLHHQVSLFLVVHLILDKCDLGRGEQERSRTSGCMHPSPVEQTCGKLGCGSSWFTPADSGWSVEGKG